MSTPAPERQVRSETRYAIAAGQEVSLKLQRLNSSNKKILHGQAIDCSVHGVKFTAPRISKDTEIAISIFVDTLDLMHETTGIVRWCRPSGKDDWYHGCQFKDALPHSFLTKLAEEGYLDRRQDPRTAIALPARIRNELSQRETTDVLVVEFSAGGLRVHASQPCDLDKRLLLEVDMVEGEKPQLIPVRPMWQQRVEDVHEIGCCFLNTNSATLLRQLSQADENLTLPEVKASERTWFWLAVAASLGIVSAGIMSLM